MFKFNLRSIGDLILPSLTSPSMATLKEATRETLEDKLARVGWGGWQWLGTKRSYFLYHVISAAMLQICEKVRYCISYSHP